MLHLRPGPFDVVDLTGRHARSSLKYFSPKEEPASLEMQERHTGANTSQEVVESLAIPSSARPSAEGTPRVSVDSQHQHHHSHQQQQPKPWWMSRRKTLPIRERVQAVLDRRFPSYHYTVPRLFIALPDDPMTTPRPGMDDMQRLQRFRVYFLCECGARWTRPLGSGLNHMHIGRHGGYAITPDRQEAFFRENGPMILALLLYLWHGSEDISALTSHATTHQRTDSGVMAGGIASGGLPTRSTRNVVAGLRDIQTIDLPKNLQPDIVLRFRTMIDFLVGLNPDLYKSFALQQKPSIQSLSSTALGSNNAQNTSGQENETSPALTATASPTTPSAKTSSSTMWSYPASLSDLRRLYGYLGLHSPQERREQQQLHLAGGGPPSTLGDMFRVTNRQGDATWVCAAHYRWTFYNAEIDNFSQWVVSRGGTVDKPTGAVQMSIVSSDQLVRLCDWIIAKSGAALIELHLKLQWKFTRKDLWKLGQAIAKTNINVLSLNGCMLHEDTGFKLLHRRHDPLLRMMEQSQLQCLELSYFPSLFRRLSNVRVHAPMMERLVFGPGTTSMDKCDMASLTSVLQSCPNLVELVVPGLIQTENNANRLVDGLVTKPLCQHLSMLDLSRSAMNDGVAYKLALGLDVTQIQHLNVSYNPSLSDRACARLIDGMRWRLTSLGMAQTGFGDRAMSTLISYLEGSENTGSHPNHGGSGKNSSNNYGNSNENSNSNNSAHDGSHPPCPLVSLDIANNQCSQQSFQALARVKRQPYDPFHRQPYQSRWVSLDLSMSSHLTDADCSQIIEKFVSPEIVKLRLGFSNIGDLSAKALASVLLLLPCYTACRLEELELQGNTMTSVGVGSLVRALKEVAAWTTLQSCDLSHSANLDDAMAHQLLRTLIETEQPEFAEMTGTAMGQGPLVVVTNPQQLQSIAACGFFSVMTELNLSSTKVGDEAAKCLARALVQSWVALETLTILEPECMTELGMATILEALTLNTTVVELGIGRSGSAFVPRNMVAGTVSSSTGATSTSPPNSEAAAVAATAVDPMSQVDMFGTALLRLLEMNKHICTLTTIGAPMQAVAKGLLLNKTLVSLYLIKTRGNFEDLQAMGEAIAYNRSLLVLWMGGSDESLLRPLIPTETKDTSASGLSGGVGGNNFASRFGRHWNGDSLQEDGLQNTTMSGSRWLEKNRPRGWGSNRRGGSLTFADMLPKSFRAHHHQDNEMTFHTTNHYNTTRKHPYMLGMGPAGGMMSTVIRNPLFDGIRRNHRLIKIRLDPVPAPLSTASTNAALSRDTSGGAFIPMTRPLTAQSLALSRRTNTTRSASVMAAGVGAGNALSPPMSPTSLVTPSSSPASPPQQGPHPLRSSISHQSITALLDQVQQQERIIQQQLAKKMAANRAALREHGRIGAEELRILRVDDDIIREICSEGRM